MVDQSGNGEEIDDIKKCKTEFVMFYILGTLAHVPQTFYFIVDDYWTFKFRNPYEASVNNTNTTNLGSLTHNITNTTVKTDLQIKFKPYYTVVANSSEVTCLIITIFLIKRYSVQGRIRTTLNCLIFLFSVTILFTWINTDSCVGACFLLSSLHLALKFPSVFLGAVLSGKSICRIISVAIQVLTVLMGTSPTVNAVVYFSTGALFAAVVEVLFVTVLEKKQYYQDHLNQEVDQKSIDCHVISKICKKIWPLLATMVLATAGWVFILALAESTNNNYGKMADTFFVPACTSLTSNIFDFIGRECSFRFFWIENKYLILLFAILRLGFIPILMFFNEPSNRLQAAVGDNWEYLILFTVIFAFSNGYLMNLCILRISSMSTSDEKKIASILMVSFVVISLVACTVLGPILVARL